MSVDYLTRLFLANVALCIKACVIGVAFGGGWVSGVPCLLNVCTCAAFALRSLATRLYIGKVRKNVPLD